MTKFSTRDLVVGDIKIEILEAGEGKPLVFLHPAGTRAGFDMLLPLAESRRLIVPFHPGFGGSEDDPAIDSVIDYVVHYGRLFDQLELDAPIDLIGHSLGGWIASMIAVFSGNKVGRLALACPVGLKVPSHPTTDLFTIPRDQLARSMFARMEMPKGPTSGPAFVEQTMTQVREMTSLARFAWFRSYEPKLDRWLDRVICPTLLLWGEEDRIVPVEQAARWAELLGGAVTTETFARTGHLIFIEEPQAVQAVKGFFAG
jgi:pimeloyl-ACP methyl ester carboxylesterase